MRDESREYSTFGIRKAAELAIAVVPERSLQLFARRGVGRGSRIHFGPPQPHRLA